MEAEGRDYVDMNDIPQETTFTQTFPNPVYDESTTFQDDSLKNADFVLAEAGLPDLDTLIQTKSGGASPQFKKLLADVIIKDKPKNESELNRVIQRAVKDGEMQLPSPSRYDPAKSMTENQRLDLKVEDYYKERGYSRVPDGVMYDRFRIEDDGGLSYKSSDEKWKQLTDKRNPKKFVKPGTSNFTKQDKDDLFPPVTREPEIEMLVRSADVFEPQPTIDETNVDDIASEMSDSLDDISTIARELQQSGIEPREIRGLDQAAQSIRGNIAIQTSKLLDVQQKIEAEKQKPEPDQVELERLEDEKRAIINSLNNLREQTNNQITSIKETINKLKDERLTLWEKIKLIFSEQGLTIGAILTSIGLLIGLIVKSATNIVTGGGGGGGSSGGDDNIVKRGLKKLASMLKDLAAKALDALPGIIGSIVSTLLKSGAAVVSYFANHLWAFGATMGLVIYQTFINTDVGKKIKRS